MTSPRWLALLSVLGCAEDYTYVPTTNATVVHAQVAAQYPIPPNAPRGNLQLVPFGMSDIRGERTLHVRAIVRDGDTASWTVDTREQRVELDGAQPAIVPVFAASSDGVLPVVTVPPGGRRVIDLYYPLPPTMAAIKKLPAFDAIWTVRTPQGPITQRTSFERTEVQPAPNVYSSDNGAVSWGSSYWYYGSPFYPPR
jgi:hypothetical protein